MNVGGDADEPLGYVVSRGWLADFILRLSRPVFAWPGEALFRVVLHGHGFFQRVEPLPPRIGFYITYFVAARDVRSAEAKAVKRLNERWEAVYRDDSAGGLIVDVEEVEQLRARFLLRSRQGFAFYSSE